MRLLTLLRSMIFRIARCDAMSQSKRTIDNVTFDPGCFVSLPSFDLSGYVTGCFDTYYAFLPLCEFVLLE
jgi:hypothetical protein